MFAFYKKHNNNLYNKLVELSRNIFFYKSINLKDDFETRIILIFVHFSIIILVDKVKRNEKFPQLIFDNVFLNIEYHLRELGYGDIAVNKKMKILNKIFYDILLKINKSSNNEFLINNTILKNYFGHLTQETDKKMQELASYFDNFYKFCFDLSPKNMIQGLINFK